MAVRITQISDLMQIKSQLQDPKIREMYSCVVIDTIDKFEEMASRYTANNKDVEIVEDLKFGRGNKYLNAVIGMVSDIRNLGLPVHFVAQAITTEDIVAKTTKVEVKLKQSTKAQIFQDAFLVGLVYPDPKARGDIDADRLITFKKTSVNVDLKDVFGMPNSVKISDLPKVFMEVIENKYKKENITNDEVMEEIKQEGDFNLLLEECKSFGNHLVSAGFMNEAVAVLATTIGTEDDGSPKNLNGLHEGQLDLVKMVHFKLKKLIEKHNVSIT